MAISKITGSALGKDVIMKDVVTADGSSPTLTLQTGDTDIAADDVLGTINFQAPDEGAGTDAILVAAGIRAVSEGDFSSSSNATRLEFHTGASEAAAVKMMISSAGNVGIGNTNPEAFGSLIDNLVIGTTSGNNGMTIVSGTDAGGRLCFSDNTASPQRGMIEYSHDSDTMLLNANGSTRITIGSGGDIDVETGDIFFSTAGKGIVLGATSNTAANTLDDYEEGTFTPAFAQSGATIGYSAQAGNYTKVGRLVHATGRIFVSSVSGGSGAITITGLPFTSLSSHDHSPVLFATVFNGWSSTNAPKAGYISNGSSTIQVVTNDSSDARDALDSSVTGFGDGSVGLIFGAIYPST